MDECPNCGARLAGDPSWCPRCLSRLDRVDRTATAREFAAVWGAAKGLSETASPPATVGPPPSTYTPYTPPPPPVANPAVAAAAAGASTSKNRIPRTVVLAIL